MIRFLKLDHAIIAYFGSEKPVNGDAIVCTNPKLPHSYGTTLNYTAGQPIPPSYKAVLWEVRTLEVGEKVTPVNDALPEVKQDYALFRNTPTLLVHSYIIIDDKNFEKFGSICKERFEKTRLPYLAIRLVDHAKHLHNANKCATIPASEVEEAEPRVPVCIYYNLKGNSYTDDDAVIKVLMFIDRAEACRFAQCLAELLHTSVRLGFADMEGKGNDNGSYFAPKQRY